MFNGHSSHLSRQKNYPSIQRRIILLLVVFLSAVPVSHAFSALPIASSTAVPSPTTVAFGSIGSSTSLFGLPEWRRRSTDTTDASNDATSSKNHTVLLLPFALEEALLVPGQSQSLVLKEGRFFDMLEEAMEDHGSVIGTLLMGGDTRLPIMPLCEVTRYELDAGYRGKVTATVTLTCVGRAVLLELEQLKPFMRGTCCELLDIKSTTPSTSTTNSNDEEEALVLVQDIEQMLTTASPDAHTLYQKTFWTVLTALGYKPTSLLTRDPVASNSFKELEAASWAALQTIHRQDSAIMQRYQAFACDSVVERLQIVRRSLLEQNLQTAQDMADLRQQQSDDTGSSNKANNSSTDGSSSSFFGTSGFE